MKITKQRWKTIVNFKKSIRWSLDKNLQEIRAFKLKHLNESSLKFISAVKVLNRTQIFHFVTYWVYFSRKSYRFFTFLFPKLKICVDIDSFQPYSLKLDVIRYSSEFIIDINKYELIDNFIKKIVLLSPDLAKKFAIKPIIPKSIEEYLT